MARSRHVLRVSLRFFIFPLLLLHGLNLAAQQRPRGVHFMHGYPASHPPRVSAAPLDLLNYYGGPVISNVRVIAVFWTSQVDAGEQANAPGFYSAVTNSPWMDLLAQYSTVGLSGFTGHAPSNQTIGRGSFQGAITITPANHNTTLNDLAIRNELLHQISIGALPAPQLDSAGYPKTLYMIYFPLSITISDPGIG